MGPDSKTDGGYNSRLDDKTDSMLMSHEEVSRNYSWIPSSVMGKTVALPIMRIRTRS